MGIGGVILALSVAAFSNEASLFSAEVLLPIFVSALFAVGGALGLYFGTAPMVFDKLSGHFWEGRKSPQDVGNVRSLKYAAELSQIHALQILAEYVRSDSMRDHTGKRSPNNPYYSYELNLVLNDGARINVIDHGNQTRLQEDAKTLSVFLGKPVWDATE